MSTPAAEPSADAPTLAADDSVSPGRPPARPATALRRGDSIGRYLVLDPLGEGGMGVVYAAYDPELDRKVAIKFLRVDDHEGGRGRQRMQREAQAMARLTHRNVVGIYDVGVADERVFVAMELIEGQTLRGWLAAAPRGWREVLAALLQAGEGLAAAHAAGLVHRDFKPENVLVARDGRVCVADFGLASAASQPIPAEPGPTAGPAATGALTVPGAVMGTPGYMAPEQFRGEPTSAATDIFAFCVTAHEALFGQRPFAGDTLAELAISVCSGELQPPPTRARVGPSRLARLLRAGLDPEPSRRPPSMRALLDALARAPGARRRWLVAGAGLAATAAIAGALALQAEGPTCAGAEAAIAEVWSPDAAQRVRAGFAATGLHYAADTAARVEEGLTQYAGAWARARTAVCEATHVRGEQSGRLLDLRMLCLDRRRERLAGLLAILSAADAGVVERGVSLVRDLPDIEDCADAQTLLLDEEPEEAIAADDRAFIEDGMARAQLLHRAGRYAEARAAIKEPVERAWATAGPRLRARALRAQASMLCFEDDETSPPPVREALEATLAAGDLRGFADVASCMLDLEHDAGRDMEVWLRLAEAALTAAGGDEQILAKALTNYGNALRRDHRREEAITVHREVVELRRRPSNRRPEALGDALFNLSSALLGSGEEAEGIRLLDEAIAVWERELGPDHPRLVMPLRTLTIVHFRRGELAQSQALAERALASVAKQFDEEHPRVGDVHGLLGNALLVDGKFERARVHFAAAVASARANPSKRRALAYALSNQANLHMAMGELDAAAAALAEAGPILRALVEAPNPDLMFMDGNLGILALRRGDLDAAELHLRAALEMFERVKEPGQDNEPDIDIAFAELLARRGDARGALAALERLPGDGLGGLVFTRDRAAALAVQARARWELGEHAAALASAREAADLYAKFAPGYPVERESLARWQAERAGR